MKNTLLIFIKINILSFLFIFLSYSAQRASWTIFKLNNTLIYLGLVSESNMCDMDYKKIPIALGENEQQSLSKRRGYKFLIGSLEEINCSKEQIYTNATTVIARWDHPVIKIVEPRIMIQDIYNENSLFYIADRLKPRIHTIPVRLEYHGDFAKIEAIKDLKKCYEVLLLRNNEIKNKSIGLLPLKIDIPPVEISQILVESLTSFITQHQDSYRWIYILVDSYDQYRSYTYFLNSFINTTK